MGVVSAATAAAGTGLVLLGMQTPMAAPIDFPYLGRAIRAVGFTPAPAMLASLIVTGIWAWVLLRARGRRGGLVSWWVMAALAASFALTQAKILVALLSGLLLARGVAARLRTRRALACAAAAVLALVYVAASHVILLPGRAAREDLNTHYAAGPPVLTVRMAGVDLALVRSNYWINKEASWRAIGDTWPKGLGPGRHNQYVAGLMARGEHPSAMWAADPHSTYSGTIAELGLAGTVGLALFAAALLLDLRSLGRDPLVPIVAGAVWMVAVEATTTDLMNFRHYWVALAALVARLTLPPPPPRHGVVVTTRDPSGSASTS
jgi:hypothetical protein